MVIFFFAFVVIVVPSLYRMADCIIYQCSHCGGSFSPFIAPISQLKTTSLPSSCNTGKIHLPPLTTAKQNTLMTPSSFYLHPVLPNVIENPRLVKLPPLPNLPPATTQHSVCPAVPPILCHQESTDSDGDHGKLTDEDFANQLADLKKTHGHLSLPRLRRIIMRRQKKTKVKQFRVVSSLLLYLNF